MTLNERLSELVRAAFAGIWVQSFEHDDALIEIARLCRQNSWSLATWDVDRGLSFAGQSTEAASLVNAADPLSAIKALIGQTEQRTRQALRIEPPPLLEQCRDRPGP